MPDTEYTGGAYNAGYGAAAPSSPAPTGGDSFNRQGGSSSSSGSAGGNASASGSAGSQSNSEAKSSAPSGSSESKPSTSAGPNRGLSQPSSSQQQSNSQAKSNPPPSSQQNKTVASAPATSGGARVVDPTRSIVAGSPISAPGKTGINNPGQPGATPMLNATADVRQAEATSNAAHSALRDAIMGGIASPGPISPGASVMSPLGDMPAMQTAMSPPMSVSQQSSDMMQAQYPSLGRFAAPAPKIADRLMPSLPAPRQVASYDPLSSVSVPVPSPAPAPSQAAQPVPSLPPPGQRSRVQQAAVDNLVDQYRQYGGAYTTIAPPDAPPAAPEQGGLAFTYNQRPPDGVNYARYFTNPTSLPQHTGVGYSPPQQPPTVQPVAAPPSDPPWVRFANDSLPPGYRQAHLQGSRIAGGVMTDLPSPAMADGLGVDPYEAPSDGTIVNVEPFDPPPDDAPPMPGMPPAVEVGQVDPPGEPYMPGPYTPAQPTAPTAPAPRQPSALDRIASIFRGDIGSVFDGMSAYRPADQWSRQGGFSPDHSPVTPGGTENAPLLPGRDPNLDQLRLILSTFV